MINWKDPKKELPKDGEIVAVLVYHSKECWPLSAKIIFGEVETAVNHNGNDMMRANTCDFTGAGNHSVDLIPQGWDEHAEAWAYGSDFKKPDFIRHNDHWGPLKND